MDSTHTRSIETVATLIFFSPLLRCRSCCCAALYNAEQVGLTVDLRSGACATGVFLITTKDDPNCRYIWIYPYELDQDAFEFSPWQLVWCHSPRRYADRMLGIQHNLPAGTADFELSACWRCHNATDDVAKVGSSGPRAHCWVTAHASNDLVYRNALSIKMKLIPK